MTDYRLVTDDRTAAAEISCWRVLTAPLGALPERSNGCGRAGGVRAGGGRPVAGQGIALPLAPAQARQDPAGQQPTAGRSRRDAKRC
jgi:hypothetical protein